MIGPTEMQRAFGDREAPLTLGTVRGVRGWTIAHPSRERPGSFLPTLPTSWSGSEPPWPMRLLGMGHAVWEPGVNVARCNNYEIDVSRVSGTVEARRRADDDDHELVGLDCTCGFYAYWRDEARARWLLSSVVGIIEGWGKTVIGTRGFRCERARILALAPSWEMWVSDALEHVCRRYGVPLFRNTQAMAEAYLTEPPPDDLGREVPPS